MAVELRMGMRLLEPNLFFLLFRRDGAREEIQTDPRD